MRDGASLDPRELRPLRRSEYDQLVELGAFEDERVELLRGALVTMSPQNPPHANAPAVLHRLLVLALADHAIVRSHSPLALGEWSEPEPDLAVVPRGSYRSVVTRGESERLSPGAFPDVTIGIDAMFG